MDSSNNPFETPLSH